jgi:glycosyltransferase involved in cell wall biosynthesis
MRSEVRDQPRILIISPVRNEIAHIDRVVTAVASQRLAPARWLVVDDGSTDGTLERLRLLEADVPFLTVVSAGRDRESAATRDGLALAREARNFNAGLEEARWRSFTHVMKLDGDVELPPDYLRRLIERFDGDGSLGIAGGVLEEPTPSGERRPIAIPRHHVHGAIKCYSKACLEAIGGIQPRLGWDTIDETYARMRGFATCSYTDLVSVHHRPFASGGGVLRGRARHGECAYICHYGPVWVVLRSLKVARWRPVGLSGAAFLYGYVRAAARGIEQVPDADYRSFTRRELRRRMLGPVLHIR